jgi:hypothetical protein
MSIEKCTTRIVIDVLCAGTVLAASTLVAAAGWGCVAVNSYAKPCNVDSQIASCSTEGGSWAAPDRAQAERQALESCQSLNMGIGRCYIVACSGDINSREEAKSLAPK